MKLRNPAISAVLPEPLVRVHRRLERWRTTRRQRCPIPEALWIASATVARDFGLGRTARALRLDYYKLRERLAASAPAVVVAPVGRVEALEERRRPDFVEVKVAGFTEVGAGESVVALDDGTGARMTLRVGGDPTTLVALAESFWRRPR